MAAASTRRERFAAHPARAKRGCHGQSLSGNRKASGHRKQRIPRQEPHRRRFLPNLHQHRFWVESEKRFVTLKVSSKGMRIIDKKGIDTVLDEMRARGEKV
jgi:large subunit ribosomal protein L28